MASAYSVYHGSSSTSQNTVTALSRWSVLSKTLPAVEKIKALHVYDFDNTLFKTPLPNPALWNGPTIRLLAMPETFSNGSWWHDSRILSATGQGVEKEEPRAWEGWWNEKVVELARLTTKQPDALCILLTGRSEKGFTNLIKKMVAAKGLDFDVMSLKPQVSPTNQRFQNTMHFKQVFLEDLMETYSQATEIRVYEDRPRHTAGFRKFFAEYNRRQSTRPTRGTLDAEVIQVADSSTTLDPVTEVAEIQHMVNLHNESVASQPTHSRRSRLQIKKTVCYTGYMINTEDSRKLFRLAQIPSDVASHELRVQANHITICPRSCPASILDKVGGMGSKLLWQVTAVGCYDNSAWAAAVRPVLSTAVYHTDSPDTIVVLATKKGFRTIDEGMISQCAQWQDPPSGQSLVFETTVGERTMLRLEEVDRPEDDHESLSAKRPFKRKYTGDDGRVAKNTHGQYGGRFEPRGYHSTSRGGGTRGRGSGGRGSRASARAGGGGGGRGGGRGKGVGFHYRSLDDVEPRRHSGGYAPQVSYDDSYPSLKQQRPQGPPAGPKGSHARGSYFHGRSSRGGQAGPTSNATDLQSYY